MTEGRSAGQVLGARLGAQSARGACVGLAGGNWAQQELGERARCRRAGRAAGAAGARAVGARGARGSRSGRAGQGWLGAGRVAWARGLALGCALGALGLFLARFDWIFFLSQFLDIVREPGS